MSRHYLLVSLREQLLAADDQRCAYCQTTEANTGQPMTVDHIIVDVRRRWVSVGWHPPE